MTGSSAFLRRQLVPTRSIFFLNYQFNSRLLSGIIFWVWGILSDSSGLEVRALTPLSPWGGYTRAPFSRTSSPRSDRQGGLPFGLTVSRCDATDARACAAATSAGEIAGARARGAAAPTRAAPVAAGTGRAPGGARAGPAPARHHPDVAPAGDRAGPARHRDRAGAALARTDTALAHRVARRHGASDRASHRRGGVRLRRGVAPPRARAGRRIVACGIRAQARRRGLGRGCRRLGRHEQSPRQSPRQAGRDRRLRAREPSQQ